MSKTLYLVRHAKSDWSTDMNDFQRPLNKRGRRDAPEMGRRLIKHHASPDSIVCSPAKRAIETAELLNLGSAVYDESIYEASVDALLKIIRSLDDHHNSAMLIGHNPAMTWLARELSGSHIENLPTCAVVTIRLATRHWKKAGTCPARMLDLDYPRKKA
ncbi:MAG: histidine phosphatase family protein [Kiritimatiellales bacterium]|nr:histidine phosphatase family protein [Pontiella sp.]NNJ70926.1 histidine phosphatase family protein [Kiritimatiellales bacterium]